MNYGPLIFLAAFFALASSWFGLVLTPYMQLGHLGQTNAIPAGATYPVARPGLAKEGLDVYRAEGCASCHSQQVRQSGTACDVVLTAAGTNQAATVAALLRLKPEWSEAAAREALANLPRTVREGMSREKADAAVASLNGTGAKAQLLIVPAGADIAMGWGKRQSVAADFLYDYPVMLGSQRVGPDLANVGLRLPDENWHLRHLYAPRLEVKGSGMPPYRFLFEKRRIERAPSPDALVLPPELSPGPGYEIVPRQEARALAAYLQSLRADAPLFVAPFTAPAAPATTNAPGTPEAGASTNAVSTNAPVK